MIIILILLVGFGLAFYFGKNYCEEEAMYTLFVMIVLLVVSAYFFKKFIFVQEKNTHLGCFFLLCMNVLNFWTS